MKKILLMSQIFLIFVLCNIGYSLEDLTIDDIKYLGYTVLESSYDPDRLQMPSENLFNKDLPETRSFLNNNNSISNNKVLYSYYYLIRKKIYTTEYSSSRIGQCIKIAKYKYYKVTEQSSFLFAIFLYPTEFKSYEYIDQSPLFQFSDDKKYSLKSSDDKNIVKIYGGSLLTGGGTFSKDCDPINKIGKSCSSGFGFSENNKNQDDKTYIYQTVSYSDCSGGFEWPAK